MADVVGVVGSSGRKETEIDFLGRTPSKENNWDRTGMSNLQWTKAMFVSIDGIEFSEGKPTEAYMTRILKDGWRFSTYFLMPNDVLLRQSLSLSEIRTVYENLERRKVELKRYICYGKPYIPTGEFNS